MPFLWACHAAGDRAQNLVLCVHSRENEHDREPLLQGLWSQNRIEKTGARVDGPKFFESRPQAPKNSGCIFVRSSAYQNRRSVPLPPPPPRGGKGGRVNPPHKVQFCFPNGGVNKSRLWEKPKK